MADDLPLIEDPTTPSLYYDGLAKPEVRNGILRMAAFVYRKSSLTGQSECLQVATLMRPESATTQIQHDIARAPTIDAPRLRAAH